MQAFPHAPQFERLVDVSTQAPPQFTRSAGHVHTPAIHAPLVGAEHDVPEGASVLAGHATEEPVQTSARSQGPAEARHTVPADTTLSAGQPAPVPSQTSTTSHIPTDARHTTPAVSFVHAEDADNMEFATQR